MIQSTPSGNRINPITEGTILTSFIQFAFPLMLTSLMMQSYTIADGLILGNFVNEEALGSVNTISSVTDLMVLVQTGLSGGCSICISHLAGSQSYSEIHRVIRQMRTLVVGISIAACLLGVFFADTILALIQTPPEIYIGARTYLQIICIGIPFSSLYQLQAGIMRGMGDSRKPLGAITISTFTNIGLDLLLVSYFSFEIIGAATATVAAQAFSCFYLLLKLKKKLPSSEPADAAGSGKALPFSNNIFNRISGQYSRHQDFTSLVEIMHLGIPQMLQSSFTSLGKIILQGLINSFGTFVVIGVAASYKIDSILIIPMIGVSMSISVFVGQNIGANNLQRAKASLRIAIIISLTISFVMTIILFLYNLPMLSWFGLSSASLDMGHRYILICLPGYFLFGLQFVFNGFLQGTKNTRLSSGISILALAGRIAFAYAFSGVLGSSVLPSAELFSWVLGGSLSGVATYRIIRRSFATE